MIRHPLPSALCFLLFTAWAPACVVAQATAGFAVVELFTSQGCSSCPPADKVLSEIAADARTSGRQVYALSFHVDYWNRLGWKDPYSQVAFSRRQSNYVSAGDGGEIFTPQVFVNGHGGFVGSDKAGIQKAIDEALHQNGARLTVRTDSIRRDTLFLSFTGSLSGSGFSLAFAIVQERASNSVTRGENKGRTLVHTNVVRVFDVMPLRNRTGRAAVALHRLKPGPGYALIALVQRKGTREVVAATELSF